MKRAWVATEVELAEAVAAHMLSDEFVLDVETKGEHPLDPRRNIVYWIVLASADRTDVIPFGHPNGRQIGVAKEPRTGPSGVTRNFKVPVYSAPPAQLDPGVVMTALRPLLFSSRRKIGHNIKFDLESLAKYYDGVIPPGPYGDTWGAAWILNENFHQYSLEACVDRSFKVRLDKTITAKLHLLPFERVRHYVFLDGRYDWLLWCRLKRLLKEQRLWKLFVFEMDVLEVCCDMEQAGLRADREALEQLDVELDKLLGKAESELYRIAGRRWNPNSIPDRQKVFYGPKSEGGQGLKARKLTKGGAPSCDAEALEHHAANPLVAAYGAYGDLWKLSNTYIKGWLGTGERKAVDKKRNNAPPLNALTGRIHANYKPFGTVSGRFSCSEPNLQNIPRGDTELGKRVRGLFVAGEGNVLVVADYAQIEYVVMAHYSRDPRLIAAFEQGLDFHAYVAAMLLGKDMEDVTKVERTVSKNTNFAVAYGAGIEKIAAMSGVTLRQAEDFSEAHRAMLPKLYQFTEDVVTACRSRRPPYVKTIMGRKRRLPEINYSDRKRRGYAERQAVNSVIQGSAADINKLALIRTHALKDPDMHIVATIHDEIVLEAPARSADRALTVVREGMLGAGVQELLSVPLACDSHVVTRWGDAK